MRFIQKYPPIYLRLWHWACQQTGQFYQDNDLKRKPRLIRKWFLYNSPKVLHPLRQSPGLNPTNTMWNELDRHLRKHSISSVQDVKYQL